MKTVVRYCEEHQSSVSLTSMKNTSYDSSKARRAGYHNTDFCKHFLKRDLEENSCRSQYSLYPRGHFPRHNCYMTMWFGYMSSIVLLPLIRLIIELEWGSPYMDLRKSGMVSSKNSTGAHETTNLQTTSVLHMAERIATTTVLLFWYVNIGGRLQMHFQ